MGWKEKVVKWIEDNAGDVGDYGMMINAEDFEKAITKGEFDDDIREEIESTGHDIRAAKTTGGKPQRIAKNIPEVDYKGQK